MNMMAISAEHLGQQVQCPHCQAVVQTPPASAFGLAPAGPDPTVSAPPSYGSEPPSMPQQEQPESIFAEAAPSEDVFDQPVRTPQIRMPDDNHEAEHGGVAVEEAPEEEEYEEPADLSAMRARLASARQASSVAPTLLIFLVPYAICCTGFIAYLLYFWPTIDRLDYLPDPKMLKALGKQAGGIRLPAHGLELAANRRVPLGRTIRVGDIEVTPVNVWRQNRTGALQLEFTAKNLSPNPMTPIDQDFFATGNKGSFRPYTYIACAARTKDDDEGNGGGYGGHLEYFDGDLQKQRASGEIPTDGTERILLTTDPKSLEYVNRIKGNNCTWRIQLRRGNIMHLGNEVPVTCVIGVDFSEADIKAKG
jgi:hypothetical protein